MTIALGKARRGDRQALFARQADLAGRSLNEMPQPIEQLHALPRVDDPLPLLLGRGKVGEERFVPSLDRLPIGVLAQFEGNPQELGPRLLAANVLIGLVNERLQPRRGIAEMAAAIE